MGSFVKKKLDNVCNVAETRDNWITNHLIISYSFCALSSKVTHITETFEWQVQSEVCQLRLSVALLVCCYRIWLRCEWLCGLNKWFKYFLRILPSLVCYYETNCNFRGNLRSYLSRFCINEGWLSNYPVLHFTLLDGAQKEYLVI